MDTYKVKIKKNIECREVQYQEGNILVIPPVVTKGATSESLLKILYIAFPTSIIY